MRRRILKSLMLWIEKIDSKRRLGNVQNFLRTLKRISKRERESKISKSGTHLVSILSMSEDFLSSLGVIFTLSSSLTFLLVLLYLSMKVQMDSQLTLISRLSRLRGDGINYSSHLRFVSFLWFLEFSKVSISWKVF